jgi:hypothetical protein
MLEKAKAISIWQPWATAIALGLKRNETRSWSTPYRGPILVCASKRWNPELEERQEWLAENLREMFGPHTDLVLEFNAVPVLGAIVAIADLVECSPTIDAVKFSGSLDQRIELMLGDFTVGRFAWQIENVRRLPQPVPCRGQQGLFDPPPDVVDQVAQQFRGVGAARA